ncbi:NADH-quinone oxidoreductase subunit A [Desulfovibrio inopinatus]|uniref:NADH-quinone oxidoreductase subunit A n=1 Tax=Desulfovibrio inopinatus TaxID=102109 RepID=UPI0003FE4E56|nr:NADH-quinone oxidoreductase subunit A [Desulfovibrio inopinatus]
MVFSWLNVAILMFLLMGLAFAGGPLVGSILLAPKARGGAMGLPYECGMPPHGPSWIRFGISYYFYALIFLAFDVDVLYLFPVATWYPRSAGFFPFVEILIFVGVLFLAILYFLKKGVFTWPRKIC